MGFTQQLRNLWGPRLWRTGWQHLIRADLKEKNSFIRELYQVPTVPSTNDNSSDASKHQKNINWAMHVQGHVTHGVSLIIPFP